MQRPVFTITLGLLLLSTVTLLNSQPASAAGTIYIRVDGSVDPVTAPIQRNGNKYTLTDDIYNESIAIEKDDIVLDGANHFVKGHWNLDPGIGLMLRENVTIANITVNSFSYGIRLYESLRNKLINVTVLDSAFCGVWLFDSHFNSLKDSFVRNSGEAVYLELSNYNNLSSNEIRESEKGILIYGGTGNVLRNNAMISNKYNFGVWGFYLFYYLNDVDTSNTVDGKPVYYLINRHDETVPSDAGNVIIVNSTGMVVKDMVLRNNYNGVMLAYTDRSLIENVTAVDNRIGIIGEFSCDSNVIINNRVNNSQSGGICVLFSYYGNISCNTVQNTNSSGIWLENTASITVSNNNVSYSRTVQTAQEFDGCGILLDDTPLCNVTGNNIYRNKYGIGIGAQNDFNNTIAKNNIVENEVGLLLVLAHYNLIYHNNFVNNSVQARNYWHGYDEPTHNTLDLGVYGGNYWSDYSGNDGNHDGIGDDPYIVNQPNVDHYPLMHPWRPWDVKCDGTINVLDLINVANALGSKSGEPRWNPNADVKEDNTINVLDLILVAKHLGT